ncbi:MAG TPA: hypothetical protein PLP29_11985 [Candidatus Ozemobacteraceae bacterium]|nr:hypothetical protein [Candidatus Ozemobacteraceae bacterium]
MPFSKSDRERLAALFSQEGARQDTQRLLQEAGRILGDDAFVTDLLLVTWQERLMRDLHAAQDAWFSALGWWLARLLIWSSLAAGLLGVWLWGPPAVDPLTWGLAGATCYYIIIQLLGPWRLKKERQHLDQALAGRRDAIAKIIESIGNRS